MPDPAPTAATELLQIDALGAKGAFRSRNRELITDVAGREIAELSLVPALFINRTMAALRRAVPLPADERVARIVEAARRYAEDTINGQTPDQYHRAVSRAGGIPLPVVRRAAAMVAERLTKVSANVLRARPVGAVSDWRDPLTRSGCAVWTRRGEVFAVHAAGNHPGPHGTWPEALALGYRVAVRPSRRDPFTPYRVISALRAAGFPDDQVALLPTDHAGAQAILREADLGMVYGGADVVERYASDPNMLPMGPGRSKILVTADVDWRDHLDTIASSVSHHGGVGCINTTAVFVEGDPEPLCAALAQRLAALPFLAPDQEGAMLAVKPLAEAKRIAAHAQKRAEGQRSWWGSDDPVVDLGDGSGVLRPAVFQLDRPDAPQAAVELSFPCVWVVPWTPAAGVAPLRETLVLTAITEREELVDQLLNEPTISNVYVGGHPTHHMAPEIPHDGFLADFLMRTKGMIR